MPEFDNFSLLAAEEDRLKNLQALVDCGSRMIISGRFSSDQIKSIKQQIRQEAQKIIPDQMDLYDLIYESRFRRLQEQFPSEST